MTWLGLECEQLQPNDVSLSNVSGSDDSSFLRIKVTIIQSPPPDSIDIATSRQQGTSLYSHFGPKLAIQKITPKPKVVPLVP